MREINISDLIGIWFHDVNVPRLAIDYFKREVEMECVIEVGFWNSPNRFGLTEGAVKGTLVLTGLLFWVMEAPDANSNYEDNQGIEIGGECSVQSGTFESPLPKMPRDLPAEAFLHCFYVADWNSCIFVAATGAHFQQR